MADDPKTFDEACDLLRKAAINTFKAALDGCVDEINRLKRLVAK